MGYFKLLRNSDVNMVVDGVYATLGKVGFLCQNAELLRALDKAGARVDTAAERVFFPRAMTKHFVTHFQNESKATDHNPSNAFQSPNLPTVDTQLAQFFYDSEKNERRSGNKTDMVQLIKIGQMLHPEAGVGHGLALADVPSTLEPLEAGLLLAEYAGIPAAPFVWNVRQIDYLREMGEILGYPNWFNYGAIAFAHPLRMEKDSADKFVHRLKSGVRSARLTAMPVIGVTTPVTVGGFLVVVTAEYLAGWICARILNSRAEIGGSILAGTVDMKTGGVSFSAFDAMWSGFALAEFIADFLGVTISVGGGEYCDAQQPGLFAVMEKAYKAMTIAAFTGRHPDIGSGMLEAGKTISPVQLLLEREFTAGAQFLARPAQITPETITLETIFDVGLGIDRNHLVTDHTCQHFRQALWLPDRLLERAGWQGFQHEHMIIQKAQQQVNELVANYKKPPVEPDTMNKLRAVVRRAYQTLL